MAIYKVTDTEAKGANPRLIKAASAAIAVRHVTADRFKAETITKVEDAADLMAKGIELETAGEAPPPRRGQRRTGSQGDGASLILPSPDCWRLSPRSRQRRG